MKIDDYITIIPSITLTANKITGLIGRRGKIVDICYRNDGTVYGVWVELEGDPFMDEQEWYIPINSFTL